MRHNTRLVGMYHDKSTVLSGKIHLHLVDPGDPHLAAAQGFAPDREDLAVHSGHADIRSVGINLLLFSVNMKMKIQSLFLCDPERIGNTPVIRGEAHNAAQKRPVRAVSPIGPGKRTVKGKIHRRNGAGSHLAGQKSDRAGSRGMGTGRADHIRAQYVKNTDKSHERFLSENICDIRSFLSIIPGLKKFKSLR